MRGIYDEITDKNPLILLCDLCYFVFFVRTFAN